MKTLKIQLNKENAEILTNFFEMNEDGTFGFSEKKQREFLKKLMNKK